MINSKTTIELVQSAGDSNSVVTVNATTEGLRIDGYNVIPWEWISVAMKNVIVKRKKEKPDISRYMGLSVLLRDSIKSWNEEAILPEERLRGWCNDFRLIIEQDKRTEQQIKNKIKAVSCDEFWRKNILSAAKLRTRWNEGKLSQLGFENLREQRDDEPLSYSEQNIDSNPDDPDTMARKEHARRMNERNSK